MISQDFSAFIPVFTVSEANRASHEHWRARQSRAKSQRLITNALLWQQLKGKGRPTVVHLTRFATRSLDSDNLSSAHKAIRDQIAKLLGFDDRDKAVLWRYDQQKPVQGAELGTGIRISWKALGVCPHCGQQIMPSV